MVKMIEIMSVGLGGLGLPFPLWLFWWILILAENPFFWIIVIVFAILYYRQKKRYEKLLKQKQP